MVAPALRSASPAAVLPPASASRKCSVEMYSSFISSACLAACSQVSLTRAAEVDVERCAVRARQLLDRAFEVGADDARVGAELAEDARHDAALLVEERDEQVLGADLGVVLRDGDVSRAMRALREP